MQTFSENRGETLYQSFMRPAHNPKFWQNWASLVAQLLKNLPAMPETSVRSLGWEDLLEKGKATHSSILAWRIPWIQSMGSQRVRHDWVTFTSREVKRKNVPDKNTHKSRHTQNKSEHEVLFELTGDKKPCESTAYVPSGWDRDRKAVGSPGRILHTMPIILDFIPSSFSNMTATVYLWLFKFKLK